MKTWTRPTALFALLVALLPPLLAGCDAPTPQEPSIIPCPTCPDTIDRPRPAPDTVRTARGVVVWQNLRDSAPSVDTVVVRLVHERRTRVLRAAWRADSLSFTGLMPDSSVALTLEGRVRRSDLDTAIALWRLHRAISGVARRDTLLRLVPSVGRDTLVVLDTSRPPPPPQPVDPEVPTEVLEGRPFPLGEGGTRRLLSIWWENLGEVEFRGISDANLPGSYNRETVFSVRVVSSGGWSRDPTLSSVREIRHGRITVRGDTAWIVLEALALDHRATLRPVQGSVIEIHVAVSSGIAPHPRLDWVPPPLDTSAALDLIRLGADTAWAPSLRFLVEAP